MHGNVKYMHMFNNVMYVFVLVELLIYDITKHPTSFMWFLTFNNIMKRMLIVSTHYVNHKLILGRVIRRSCIPKKWYYNLQLIV